MQVTDTESRPRRCVACHGKSYRKLESSEQSEATNTWTLRSAYLLIAARSQERGRLWNDEVEEK